MRRVATLLLLCWPALALADEPKPFDPVGIWEGSLDLGMRKLKLAFKITKAEDGSLKGTMDAVTQGAKDIPVASVKVEDGQLNFDLTKIGATYSGKPAVDGQSVKGTWKQSGHEFELELKRVAKVSEAKRPQHPVKPYPYREEEVTVDNPAAKDVKLAGTITWPTGKGPFPAVVLITGSGPQDRDETVFDHKPFLVLADHLTRNGIAVLRCDDRGVGKSTGSMKDATTADFATDAYACVKFLQTRSEIDRKHIGLAGHSEGGLIAPMVAAEHPDEIGFIVMLAGTGLPGDEVLIHQSAALRRAMKTEGKKFELGSRLQAAYMKAARETKDPKVLAEQIRVFMDSLPPEDAKHIASADKKDNETQCEALCSPWVQYFIHCDPRASLKKVRCPVLAINGELDLQVTPKENLPAIEGALKEAGNKDVTVRVFPGLNHLFQHCKTGMPNEYGEIEETMSPEVLDVITQWIIKRKS
ncbi:MAG: alpha/beta hydrolase family protein [Gemmataceae bacterium]